MSKLRFGLPVSIRISGNSDSRYFWKNFFSRMPTVKLNGKTIEHVSDAKSGPDGYVIVEMQDQHGRPRLADVVLDGEVIDRIIVRQTLRGVVEIEGERRWLS